MATVVAFISVMALFALIGASSAWRKQSTAEDYLLASRTTGPWFTALAAVATNNSGFMFIGLIGTTYLMGVSGVWIMVGWVAGDYLMWFWLHRRMREFSETADARTIPSLLGAGVTGSARAVQVCAALITIIFLATYAAAQFTAGSKALQVILGWDRFTSAALGAAIVLLYCFAGGVRASIWTNVAQSFVMLGAMIMLLWTALSAVGGPQALWQKLHAIDPDLVNPVPAGLRFGFPLYLAGWLLAGVGVVGQPHVMLAVLTAREGKDLDKARHIYFGWYVFFSAAALGVALCCRVLIPQTATFDPELALPILAAQRLPAALVGLVLAGLFAAAMSTADSQLLSCSGAVTQDLFGDWRESYWASKITTAVWTGFALALALNLNQTVFSLVALSWSALAVTIGPVLAAVVFRRPLTGSTAIGIMVSALIAVVAWRFLLGYSAHVYEVLPGMLAALLVFTIARGRSARAREVQAARDRDSSAAD